MNADKKRLTVTEMSQLTERVIGACFEVSNKLGVGFLETVYERALITELRLRGLRAEAQVPLAVTYKGENVVQYFVDVLVEGELLVELKCVRAFAEEHTAQCLNYLRASGHTLC